jgi:hypothetical protein
VRSLKNNNQRKGEDLSSEQYVSFYERMLQVIYESPLVGVSQFLSPVRRWVEWGNKQITLIILPAWMIDGAAKARKTIYLNHFPGIAEELLEKSLYQLCNADNIHFDVKNSTLYFSFTELADEYATLTAGFVLTRDQLEKSLNILRIVRYILKHRTKEHYFSPIEELDWIERGNEVYYRICFSPLYFDRGNLFDRIFSE